MTTAAQTVTDADLLALPRDGHKRELVDGVVRVTPAGARHGAVALRLGARMLLHASERRLGEVFDSSTGYRLPSGNLRVPDVSFVAAHRLPGGKVPTGFFELAPDPELNPFMRALSRFGAIDAGPTYRSMEEARRGLGFRG